MFCVLQDHFLGFDVLNLVQPNDFSFFEHFQGEDLARGVVPELDLPDPPEGARSLKDLQKNNGKG